MSRGDLRCNRRIRIPEVRLIASDGSQLGVCATQEALRLAEQEGLDLVEISPTARPPVCKIMDYGKYKYELAKKRHEAKKHQIVIKTKEIKLRPVTDEHDLQTKIKHIKRFLEDGDKVKITLRFRGREMAHLNIGRERLMEIVKNISDLGELEQFPKIEGRSMFMIVTPAKKKT